MQAFVYPAVMVICAVFGFAIKNAIRNDRVHDFIPLMCACAGVILMGMFQGWSLDNIACGAVSGIAATGLWEQITHAIPKTTGEHVAGE